MTLSTISALVESFAVCLSAEEILLGASLVVEAEAIRQAGEALRSQARSLIEKFAILPANAFDRLSLQEHAEVLEGVASPFALQIAQALMAETSGKLAAPAA